MTLRSLACLSLALSLSAAASVNALAADDQAPNPAPTEQPYEYMRGEVQVPCMDDEKANCIWHRLIVDNQSGNTLICTGRMNYSGVDRDQKSSFEGKMVILPRVRRVVISDNANPDVTVTTHTMQCSIRPAPDSSKLTPKCKTLALNAPGSLDYPAESRLAGEEGPVLLDFSLTDKAGHPTDVVVAGTSLWPRLDEAGVKYVSQFVGATDCKHGRFRIPVTFQLR